MDTNILASFLHSTHTHIQHMDTHYIHVWDHGQNETDTPSSDAEADDANDANDDDVDNNNSNSINRIYFILYECYAISVMQFTYMLFNLIRFASFNPILTFSTWTIFKKQIIITTSWNAAIWFQWNWMNLLLFASHSLSLFSSSSSFAFLLDNGRLFLPLRPYIFYPSRFPCSQPTNSLSYFIPVHVCVCACVSISYHQY